MIQRHALDRDGMTELVTDAEVLRKLEPNYELLKAMLSFKGLMQGEVWNWPARSSGRSSRNCAAVSGAGSPGAGEGSTSSVTAA